MLRHNEDLENRETEMESMRISNEQKEKEKQSHRSRAEEARNEIIQLHKEVEILQKKASKNRNEVDIELDRYKNEHENELRELEN